MVVATISTQEYLHARATPYMTSYYLRSPDRIVFVYLPPGNYTDDGFVGFETTGIARIRQRKIGVFGLSDDLNETTIDLKWAD